MERKKRYRIFLETVVVAIIIVIIVGLSSLPVLFFYIKEVIARFIIIIAIRR